MHFPDPVISRRIEPKTNADRDRLTESLARLAREDPTFRTRVDAETGETIVEGMGELHLEVLTNRLVRDFGVGASVGKPRVAYRQTVAAAGEAEARFERQIASKVHAAVVRLRVEPAPGSGKVEFHSALRPEQLPKAAVAAIERGVASAGGGGLSYPVIDVRATLVAGSFPPDRELSEIAFEFAGSQAFGQAFEAGGPVVLEPAMRLEVHTPAGFTGEVLSDLNRRRAVVEGSEQHGDLRILAGRVPLSEMFGYSTAVRSLTQGRAAYTLEPAGWEPVPPEVAKNLTF
jgi:elongation factor G